MLKIIFISFLFSTALFSQEESLEQVNFSTVEDLNQRKDEVEKNIYFKKEKLKWAKNFTKKIEQEDIEKSGTFKAFLTRGTVLLSLDNTKKYILPKDIYAVLFRMQDKEGYQYLLDKNEQVKYKVKATEASNIEVITDLDKRPHYYTPVEIKNEKPFFDDKPSFWLETNIMTGLTLSNVTRDLVGKDDSSFARSFKMEAVPYFDLNFPVNLGLSLQWESMTMSLDGGTARQEMLTVGPAFQTNSFNTLGTPLKLTSSIRYSLYGHVSQNQTAYSRDITIHATAFQLGLIKDKDLKVGTLTYGIQYQREWLRAKADDTSLNLKSQNTFNDIFGLSLGWRWM